MTDQMTLTVVGCAGSFPAPDSPTSCYLVQAPHEGGTFNLLLDLGSGALGPLQSHVSLDDVHAVALSHLHADHCLDLTGYYVVRKYHPDGALPRIPVHGPSGTADRLARAYDLPLDPGMTAEFDFHEWHAGEPTAVGPFEISVVLVDHPVEAYALRVAWRDKVLVYSGDTGPTDALVDLAGGADVLLCEASFVESAVNPEHLHLTGAQAGDHATRAGVGRLLITHVPAWTDRDEVVADAKSTWNGDLDLVNAGDVFVV
ncbi:MBL fold metallo-hydrolase [Solicola sp. PLA-1-18]|uniref:MBL fold metallo-hydrolase n=1 Tax=Solicola sp. PLA-1-18 TaxID=3380532 RepID=UPI003B7A92F2